MKMLSDCTILVVDDTEFNRDLLFEILKDTYHVLLASNGQTALEMAEQTQPDIILLDIMMPRMDGYEVCRRLKACDATHHIPVIFITALSEMKDEAAGLALGAVDYITKPVKPAIVVTRIRNHLELKRYRDHLEELVKERTQELMLTQDITIESMAALAEYRDPETGGHIQRTRNYIRRLSEYLHDHPTFQHVLTPDTIELLHKSAPLHDIGKVGIPDHILLKPGKLTEEEFEEMKLHTLYGRNALRAAEKKLGYNSFLRLASEIAYTHHEKWDGSGYPEGLRGDEIPISGRLMALADVYDALISKRVYKPPFPHHKAVSMISDGSGIHFDPEVVAAFLKIEDEFRQIAIEHADYDEERENLSQHSE